MLRPVLFCEFLSFDFISSIIVVVFDFIMYLFLLSPE